MRISRQSHSGFSLVEILCAILILGVGLLGLVQGLTTALGSNKESEWQTSAALIAAGRIELLQADGFLIEGEESGTSDDSRYRWQQSITRTSLEGLYEIHVAVELNDAGRKLYELDTLLFDPPLPTSSPEATRDGKAAQSRKGARP